MGAVAAEPKEIDPLADLDIDIQTFDIARKIAVYPDRDGIQWWIKAWFNNRRIGEGAIPIDRMIAIEFIHDYEKGKDDWLEEYYPQQMQVYHQAIEQTKAQLINQMKIKSA